MGKVNKDLPVIKMTPKQAAASLALAGWPQDQWATGVAVGIGESGLDVAVENELGADGWLQVLRKAHPDLFAKLPNPYAWTDPVTNAKMALQIYRGAGNSWGPWEAYTGPDGRGSDGPYAKHLAAGRKAAADLAADLQGKDAKQRKAYYTKLFQPVTDQITAVQLLQGVSGVADEIQAAGNATGAAIADSGGAVVDAVGEIGRELAAFSNFFQALLLPGTWLRVGCGALGCVLIVAGMVALGREAAV